MRLITFKERRHSKGVKLSNARCKLCSSPIVWKQVTDIRFPKKATDKGKLPKRWLPYNADGTLHTFPICRTPVRH